MRAETRFFGEIEIEDDKIIRFANGIVGFPQLKNFTLIYDNEKGDKTNISWLQSLDDGQLAFPVLDPLLILPDYNPSVEDELLKPLGEIREDNLFVLVTVTIPKKVEELAVNLKAPIVVNTDTLNANQIIVDGDYPVKYKIYEQLKAAKEKAGE